MWFLPTYGRPARCQETLDSIQAAGTTTRGVVVIDGDTDPAYRGLRLPDGWMVVTLPQNLGVCGALNHMFDAIHDEKWYGFISDDSVVLTEEWDTKLVEAAGTWGFASSADGWQGHIRMHGAVVFGGDMLRAFDWWAPPGLVHSYVDDAWEMLAGKLHNWVQVPDVIVEHRHFINRKAPEDATYTKAYETAKQDRDAWNLIKEYDIDDAALRALPVIMAQMPAGQRRLARVKSRSLMIATPVARSPGWRYTASLVNTVVTLERMGIPCEPYFVVGNSNLPRARNECVAHFLASRHTDMLFIDDDMDWKPDAVVQVLASEQPLVGVAGRMRVDKPNTDPAVWCLQLLSPEEGITQDDFGCIKLRSVGTGFLRIHREVFVALAAAHPEWKRAGTGSQSDAERENYYRFFAFGDDHHEMGEDYGFCAAWRELGGEVWIYPDAALGHTGERTYTGAASEMFVAAEDEEVAHATDVR